MQTKNYNNKKPAEKYRIHKGNRQPNKNQIRHKNKPKKKLSLNNRNKKLQVYNNNKTH